MKNERGERGGGGRWGKKRRVGGKQNGKLDEAGDLPEMSEWQPRGQLASTINNEPGNCCLSLSVTVNLSFILKQSEAIWTSLIPSTKTAIYKSPNPP